MDFQNLVTLKSRTGEEVKMMYDSKELKIPPKKGLKVPRFVAELGVEQNAFRWSPESGLVKESRLYIEEDIGTPEELPSSSLSENTVQEVKKTDGLGRDSIMVDGKFIKKKSIDLGPPDQENYKANNL